MFADVAAKGGRLTDAEGSPRVGVYGVRTPTRARPERQPRGESGVLLGCPPGRTDLVGERLECRVEVLPRSAESFDGDCAHGILHDRHGVEAAGAQRSLDRFAIQAALFRMCSRMRATTPRGVGRTRSDDGRRGRFETVTSHLVHERSDGATGCRPAALQPRAPVRPSRRCIGAPDDTGALTPEPTGRGRPGRSHGAARSRAFGTSLRERPRPPSPYGPRTQARRNVAGRPSRASLHRAWVVRTATQLTRRPWHPESVVIERVLRRTCTGITFACEIGSRRAGGV
jgi:hypothetical protein